MRRIIWMINYYLAYMRIRLLLFVVSKLLRHKLGLKKQIPSYFKKQTTHPSHSKIASHPLLLFRLLNREQPLNIDPTNGTLISLAPHNPGTSLTQTQMITRLHNGIRHLTHTHNTFLPIISAPIYILQLIGLVPNLQFLQNDLPLLLVFQYSPQRYLCGLGVLLDPQDDLFLCEGGVWVWVGFGEVGFGTCNEQLLDCLVGLDLCCVLFPRVLVYVVYPQVYNQFTPLNTVILETDLHLTANTLNKLYSYNVNRWFEDRVLSLHLLEGLLFGAVLSERALLLETKPVIGVVL